MLSSSDFIILSSMLGSIIYVDTFKHIMRINIYFYFSIYFTWEFKPPKTVLSHCTTVWTLSWIKWLWDSPWNIYFSLLINLCIILPIIMSVILMSFMLLCYFKYCFPRFFVIHRVKGFSVVNEMEVDGVFLGGGGGELSYFFYDSTDIGNLISALSKFSFYIWKFLVHILLDFEHCFASMWNECNCEVVWTSFGIAGLWDWSENWPFPVLWPLLSFQICWHIECSTFTASSSRVWNCSTDWRSSNHLH